MRAIIIIALIIVNVFASTAKLAHIYVGKFKNEKKLMKLSNPLCYQG